MTELKYKLILLLLLIEIYTPQSIASVSATKSSDVDELVFAHVIFRHGNRTLLQTYETDPYKNDSYWQPEELGQLQNVLFNHFLHFNSGKLQQYKLGKFLRRRYDKLIGPGYSSNKVYIRSSDTDRTLMSAQCNAAGLFEPSSADQVWNGNIHWQPVPVHTVRLDDDYLVYQSIPCAKSDKQYAKCIQSIAVISRNQRQLYKYLEENSGSKVQNWADFYLMAEALIIEHERGLPLPDWALNVFPPKSNVLTDLFNKFAVIYYSCFIRTNETLKAKVGFLLREIFDRFKTKTLSLLKPDRSLWIYSAHDNTLLNVLNALKIFDGHVPPYASSIHMELYKSGQEYYVQIFYRKDNSENLPPIEIPRCGIKCPLQTLYKLYNDILPTEHETYGSLCRL